MKAYDLAGHTKLPRGPHAARGQRVGSPGQYNEIAALIDTFDMYFMENVCM